MTKPKLAVDQPDGSRKYVNPRTGEICPSVTTIINYMPKQDWMVPWATRMTAQYMCANWLRLSKEPHTARIAEAIKAHEDYAQERADIGDIVHELVDCWSKGVPYPNPPPEVNSYINKFIDFLTVKRPRFWENEVTLWSRQYNYAGTCDFIFEVDGKIYLADLKTGKSLHDEIGLQLSALLHCDFIIRPDGTEEPIPRIDGLAGLHLRPRSWKLVEIPDVSFPTFLAAYDILTWTTEIAPKIL